MSHANQFQAIFKLGIILVQKKLISQNQLNIALAEQKKNGKKLGTILVQKQWLKPEQLKQTLAQQRWYRRLCSYFMKALASPLPNFPNKQTNQSLFQSIKIGEILVNKGYINPLQLEEALHKQQATSQKLGEIFIEQGLLSQKELKVALNEQKWLNFVATFLFVNMSSMSLSIDSVQAQNKNTAQAIIRFQAQVPETVKVEVNPQVFASQTPLLNHSSLISVKDNANSEKSVAKVKYEEEEDRYTIIPH